MTTEEKIIKNKLGLIKLANTLGNVSQACKVTVSTGSKDSTIKMESSPCRRLAGNRASGNELRSTSSRQSSSLPSRSRLTGNYEPPMN